MYPEMVRDICEKLNGEGSYVYGQSNSTLNKSILENLEELKKLSSEVVYDSNGLTTTLEAEDEKMMQLLNRMC